LCPTTADRAAVPTPIRYKRLVFDEGFRLDRLVEKKVVVEPKTVERLAFVHCKQVLTQLRLGCYRLGLLINFAEAHLKDG